MSFALGRAAATTGTITLTTIAAAASSGTITVTSTCQTLIQS